MNNDDAWHHQMELERRQQEEDLLEKWRGCRTYVRRVCRDWFIAFDKRLRNARKHQR